MAVQLKILACLALLCTTVGVRQRRKVANTQVEVEGSAACADPVAAVEKTLGCIETKDSACATQNYNWLLFSKHHNKQNVGLRLWPFDMYWTMALKFSTFKLVYDHKQNIGTNKASVRYIEYIRFSNGTEFNIPANTIYPFDHQVIQYEHAIVSVDNSCKLTRWDQFGDNKEQVEVDDAMAVFMADERVKCDLSIHPFPWKCKEIVGSKATALGEVSGKTSKSGCSFDMGGCGREYQACCAGFGAIGHGCDCNLWDGNGSSFPHCGTCGAKYKQCCGRFAQTGNPCKCDVA